MELAGDMTKAVGRIAPFKYLNPSQAWFYAFLNRWPDLKNFLFGPRTNRKSKGVSGDAIQAYFEQLDKVSNMVRFVSFPNYWVCTKYMVVFQLRTSSNSPRLGALDWFNLSL